MTQPPTGGQQPPGWQVPGGDDESAGAGWGRPADPAPAPAPPSAPPATPAPPSAPPPAPPPAPPVSPGWGQAPGWGLAPGWGQAPGWGGPPQPWTPPVKAPAGIVPLRPLGVGEILDGAFQAVRSNPRTMIGVSAAVVAAVTLLSIVPQAFLLQGLGIDPDLSPGAELTAREQLDILSGAVEAQLLPGILTFLAVTVLTALLIVPVSAAVLGRRTEPGEMWQRARSRLLPAIGLALLTGLAVGVGVVAVLSPGIAALVAGSPELGVVLLLVGAVAAVVVALLLTVRWALAAPALVLEKAPVLTALRRSWRLTRGSFWRVLGILLLTGIIVSIGQAVISVPFGALSALPGAGQDDPSGDLGTVFARLLINGIGTIVAGAIFYPFNAAASALLYIDLRMRREGLDVRLAQTVAQGGPMP